MFQSNIKNSIISNGLKNIDISPVYKKRPTYNKRPNYWLVSILPILSKRFEGGLYEKIDSHDKNILSKHQGGFQKISASNIHY